MFYAALEGGKTIVRLLDTPEKLQYTRLNAQLVSEICFVKLKQDYLEQCYHVVHDAGVCSSALSKEMIKENHLHRIQFVTQGVIERHRQTIAEVLKLVEEAMDRHKQSEMNPTIDTHQLSSVILVFVRKGQLKVSAEFKRKIFSMQTLY